MYKRNQPFHLVEFSAWPIVRGFTVISLPVAMLCFIKSHRAKILIMQVVLIFVVAFLWWRDVSREATYQGWHNLPVLRGLKTGILLFILREVIFFFRFFWAFFHASLSPTNEIGMVWPPVGLVVIDAFSVPLLNTAILLLSGVSVTWAHHAIEANRKESAVLGLRATCALGIYFIFLQGIEYHEASFRFADSVYGSTFFIATGFHGVHVIVGTIFLIYILYRLVRNHFGGDHHVGFLSAAWYWHFVDVVWLFLFLSIYWWGGFTM